MAACGRGRSIDPTRSSPDVAPPAPRNKSNFMESLTSLGPMQRTFCPCISIDHTIVIMMVLQLVHGMGRWPCTSSPTIVVVWKKVKRSGIIIK